MKEMPEPFEFYNEPHFIGGRSNVPDRVSQDLQRRTFVIIMAAAIGIGVGVLSLVLGGPKGELVWLGFAVLALISLFLLIRYFQAGVVAFLAICWVAVGTPTIAQGSSGGGAQQLKLSQIGLVVLIAMWGVRRFFFRVQAGSEKPFRAPVNTPILLYLIISIWSTINSLLFPNQLVMEHGPKQFLVVNVLEVLIRLLALGGLLMVADTLRGRLLKAACAAIILPGIVSFSGLLSFLPSTSYLAFPQVIAMAVLAAVALTGDNWVRPWLRIVCAAVAVAILYTYFVKGTEWVSGWLGAIVALALITFTARRKAFWAACGVVCVFVLLNFNYFYQTVYVSNFYGDHATHDRSRVGHMGTFTNDRSRMWGAAFKYAEEFPLGIGLGNYRPYNLYFGRVDVWNTTAFTSAHGTYSQALSETGALGFLALLALVYTSSRMMRGYYKALPEGWAKTFVLGAWGGCTGVFCSSFNGDYLFPTYYNGAQATFGATVYTWLTIGLTVAIAREFGLDWQSLTAAARAAAKSQHPVVAPIYNRGPNAIPQPSVPVDAQIS